jgi:predicted transcriptional regulator
MFIQIKNSLERTLQDRISSPFSGAFILSWLVWNWRIIYYILFSENTIGIEAKIYFVQTQLMNWCHTLLFPFGSACLIVVFYPFITIASIWIGLKFKQLQNKIEDKTPLTVEESRELRLENAKMKKEFGEILKETQNENQRLKEENEILRRQTPSSSNTTDNTKSKIDASGDENNDFKEILAMESIQKNLPEILERITGGFNMSGVDGKAVALLDASGLITQNNDRKTYSFTEKGRRFISHHLRYKSETN